MKNSVIRLIVIGVGLFFMYSCNSDQAKLATAEEINIRLNADPNIINPLFKPTAIGREVYQYIYLPLADYHPETLELTPILITQIPAAKEVTVNDEKLIAYEIEIKPDATWSDGTTITNKDYLFTIKSILHPSSTIDRWKPAFTYLKKIELDKNNPKKLTAYFDANFMLSQEAAVSLYLLPQHVYDKENIIINLPNLHFPKEYNPQDSAEIKVIEKLTTIPEQKLELVQSGPYQLSAFESNQYILLEKLDNHWSQNYPNNPYLQSNINKIVFKIVPDEVTAITMAKDGAIDLMMLRNGQSFLDLKDDETFNANWSFHIPQLMRYTYVAINNKHKLLKDPQLRRAIAHLVDVEDLIETLEGGLASRVATDILPMRTYADDSLLPIKYDLTKAKEILDQNGWILNPNTNLREKKIGDKMESLEFEMLITGSAKSEAVALLMQASAKEIGLSIKPVAKAYALIKSENLNSFDYDMTLLVAGQQEADQDLYPRWHSDMAKPGTNNVMGYSNTKMDSLVTTLRLQKNGLDRIPIYKEINQLMYADQPIIPLYSPLNKIIISNKFRAITSSKRPGYQANSFKPNNI